ncbi:MAG: hypothetical protein ACPLKX_00695 [Dictyoglomaceae bacterium]
MKILKEIDELWKKVKFFYFLEGFFISMILPFTVLLFLNYFSLLNNNFYIIALLPLPTYIFYILVKKKPDLNKVILNSDRYFSLEERLITAWEYKEYKEPYGLMENLIKDIEEKLSDKSLKDSYSFRPSRFLRILTLIMLLLIILNIARSISPLQKKPLLSKRDKLEEEFTQEMKRDYPSKLQVSKKIPGEKITEERREKEKLLAEREKDKVLEKLLSEWNFEEEKLIEELMQKNPTSSQDKNKSSLKLKEESTSPQEGTTPYIQQKNISLDNLYRENTSEENPSNQNYGTKEDKENLPEMPKEDKVGEGTDINAPSQEPEKDIKSQGSLPGTTERKEKLGKNPTPRLNVNPEKIYVPSQEMDESKKKVYLIEAPALKEKREKAVTSLPFSLPQYKFESSTSPRVIPQDLQEIIKSYFSQ